MAEIIEKSGILVWDEENIQDVPEKIGIFVLRTSPTLDGIVDIAKTNDIRETLTEKYEDDSIVDIKFFDWYLTSTIEDAEQLANEWSAKFNIT